MSVAVKHLYDGQLPVAKTALYTVGAGKNAVIKAMVATNTDAATPRQFILYKKSSAGTSKVLANHTIGAKYTSEWDGGDISMEPGDSIEGQSPDGSTIFDVTITGYEETITTPV